MVALSGRLWGRNVGIMETEISHGIIGSGAIPPARKPLSPAFRMAVLTGAAESVRLHLLSGDYVDATEEKARSPLILAASRGHLDVCRILLEAGADRTLKDCNGYDALAVALLRGHEMVAELLSVPARVSLHGHDGGDATSVPRAGRVDPDSSGPLDSNEAVASHLTEAPPRLDADRMVRAIDEAASSLPDEDGLFDLSAWHEQVETPPPAHDPKCADDAHALQALLSHHLPIDLDASWDDVEIDLPELDDLSRRGSHLTEETKDALRGLVIEALRDGRVRGDRIGEGAAGIEGLADAERSDIEAGLRLALGDLSMAIDDELLPPDLFLRLTRTTRSGSGRPQRMQSISSDVSNRMMPILLRATCGPCRRSA